jgi:uncharacterized protein
MMLTVQQIQQTVSAYFKDKPVKKVYLFGSYARGEAKEDSDVDLLVELDYEQKIGLEFVRWGITLQDKFGRKVDLVPSSVIYPIIQANADRDKILMLQNNAS